MHRVFRRVQILVHAVRVDAGLHVDDAVEASTVGVEQELVGVKELAAVGIPRAVCAETVSRARAVARDVAVPHARLGAHEGIARLSPGLVEDAHVHAGGAAGDHRHVEAVARRVDTQTGGQRVGFGDAPCGCVGRAGSLGHIRGASSC